MNKENSILIRVNSHRAGHKLRDIFGKLKWFYTFKDGGCFVKIPSENIESALKIKGITRARIKDQLFECWTK